MRRGHTGNKFRGSVQCSDLFTSTFPAMLDFLCSKEGEEACTAYGMQISAEKTQLMTNNTNAISTDITIDNKKLEAVCSFKYLGAIVSDEGSKP